MNISEAIDLKSANEIRCIPTGTIYQVRKENGFRAFLFKAPAGDDDGILRISLRMPVLDVHGYWTPALASPLMALEWTIRLACAAQKHFPFLTFVNRQGQNRCAIALDNLADDVCISAQLNQQDACYEVTIDVAVTSATGGFELRIDHRQLPWTETLADARQWLCPAIPEFPAAAWAPVYCTWYAVHADFDLDWLEQAAEAAAGFGFGTFIVDDGWCFDEHRRVTPQTIQTWYDQVGDWRVSEEKLPQFREHIQRARQRGLNYMLWVAPFLIGDKSVIGQEPGLATVGSPREGCRILDPGDEVHGQRIMGSIAGLMDLGIDGLKVDFLDAIPAEPTSPRGRATHAFICDLSRRIRACKEDALIEYRQHYCSPQMLPLATQFRAIDLPFDANRNLLHIAKLRAILGDGVPIHADPAYWHPDETPENVARHMISAMAGVPMVSMDLAVMPEEQAHIVRFWLGFYNRHIATFRDGAWSIVYDGDQLVYMVVRGEKETLVYLNTHRAFNEACHQPGDEKLSVLNVSAKPLEVQEGFDGVSPAGRPVSDRVPPGGMLTTNLEEDLEQP